MTVRLVRSDQVYVKINCTCDQCGLNLKCEWREILYLDGFGLFWRVFKAELRHRFKSGWSSFVAV